MENGGERIAGNEEAEEELGSEGECCESADYVHGKIGRVKLERIKTRQQGLDRRQGIWIGVGKDRYMLIARWEMSSVACVASRGECCCAATCATGAPCISRMNSCTDSQGVGYDKRSLGSCSDGGTRIKKDNVKKKPFRDYDESGSLMRIYRSRNLNEPKKKIDHLWWEEEPETGSNERLRDARDRSLSRPWIYYSQASLSGASSRYSLCHTVCGQSSSELFQSMPIMPRGTNS